MKSGQVRESGRFDWLLERGTACLLALGIPWLAFPLGHAHESTRADLVGWLQNPIHALLIGLLILVTALHAALGLRSILTDYVSNRSLRSGGLILIRFTLVFSAIVGLGSLWVLIKSPP